MWRNKDEDKIRLQKGLFQIATVKICTQFMMNRSGDNFVHTVGLITYLLAANVLLYKFAKNYDSQLAFVAVIGEHIGNFLRHPVI